MKVETLKEKFLESMDKWLKERIEEMAAGNAAMAIPAVYMKRGCHNILYKYKGKIDESIDKAALFLADENGEISISTLFTDAMEVLKGIEENPFDIGLVQGMIGKGKIAIELPENMLTNILFGSKKTINLNEKDIMELKNLLTAN